MRKASCSRKRPCRICRRWFRPDSRLKDRQMTCGDPECQREWHRKMCAKWNQENREFFKENYLQKKLDAAAKVDRPSGNSESAGHTAIPPPRSRLISGLPVKFIEELVGVRHLVVFEYLAQHLFRRFQEVIRLQVSVNTG